MPRLIGFRVPHHRPGGIKALIRSQCVGCLIRGAGHQHVNLVGFYFEGGVIPDEADGVNADLVVRAGRLSRGSDHVHPAGW